jgi:hypothetical protein
LVYHNKGEHRLRLFENRVLRRIFRPKREKTAGGWRRPHNEELHNLHASPNIVRVIKGGWAGHVGRMGEMRIAYNVLVGKPGGKTQRERPRGRWEDYIRMGHREIGGCRMDPSGSGWETVAGSCEHSDEPSGSIKRG